MLSKKEFPHPRPDDNDPLSTTSLKPTRQDSSSSPPIPANAIPTLCLPPPPSPDGNKESSAYVLDFEELVAALPLDTGSRAVDFVKLSGFPVRDSIVSSSLVSRLDSERAIFEHESGNWNKNEAHFRGAAGALDTGTEDGEKAQGDRSDGDSHSFVPSAKLHETHKAIMKTQDPSDDVSDGDPTLSSSSHDPQQTNLSGPNGKTQLQEDQPKDECCPSSRLSFASSVTHVTSSGSVSYPSNVTLVLASKAVGADDIRLLINGLPAVKSGNDTYPASTFDNYVPEEKEVRFISDSQCALKELAFDARKLGSGGNQSDALAALESNNVESTEGPVPGEGHDSNHLSGLRYVLGTPEASQMPLQPPLGGENRQASNSQVSLRSEINRTENIGSYNHSHPTGDISSLPGQSNPLRKGTSLSSRTRNSLLGSVSHASDSCRSMNGMGVNPATSSNSLAIFTAQVPEDHHQPLKGYSAIDKLRSVSKFRRTSGARPADGPHKALSRLSGLFSRSGSSGLPPRSDTFSTYTYKCPNSYHSNSMQSGYDTSNRSFQGQPPPPEGYFAPPYPSQNLPSGPELVEGIPEPQFRAPLSPVPLQPQSIIPDTAPYQQDQLLQPTREQCSPRRSSIASQPTAIPPPTRKPDPLTHGRFYAQALRLRSRSPTWFPPRPDERNIPISDSSNPVHGLGMFRAQPTTCRSGDQERPWSITIPGDDNIDQTPQKSARAKKQFASIPRDIEETAQDIQEQKTTERAAQSTDKDTGHPHREGGAINETLSVELAATKDDSSEEILMTSTAYPGQEWKPAGLQEWEYY